jgi:hypothetical protein
MFRDMFRPEKDEANELLGISRNKTLRDMHKTPQECKQDSCGKQGRYH